ncbi:MAG: hypothetical protein NTV87_15910 [Ignavibacteriae bacterium]|nr:hypothetical protein [Ignavibacteriota bacterium]
MVITKCPYCGELYHSDKRHIGKNIRCTKCKELVIIGYKLPDVMKANNVKPIFNKNKKHSSRVNVFFEHNKIKIINSLLVVLLISLFVVIVYNVEKGKKSNSSYDNQNTSNSSNNTLGNSSSNNSKNTTTQKSSTTNIESNKNLLANDVKEKSLPKTGLMRKSTNKKLIAPLKITADNTDNFYIKVVNNNNGKTLLTIFLRAGSTYKTNVPIGSAKIIYASGDKWYGEKYLFGDDTRFSEADKIFDFYVDGRKIHGYEVELFTQYGGNLGTNRISKNDFTLSDDEN